MRRSRELQLHLIEVVPINVSVTERMDQLTGLKLTHLRDHHRQERVARDVEGDTQEEVGRALIELAAQPTLSDVELDKGVTRRERHL